MLDIREAIAWHSDSIRQPRIQHPQMHTVKYISDIKLKSLSTKCTEHAMAHEYKQEMIMRMFDNTKKNMHY